MAIQSLERKAAEPTEPSKATQRWPATIRSQSPGRVQGLFDEAQLAVERFPVVQYSTNAGQCARRSLGYRRQS